jgi:hypothetical protein
MAPLGFHHWSPSWPHQLTDSMPFLLLASPTLVSVLVFHQNDLYKTHARNTVYWHESLLPTVWHWFSSLVCTLDPMGKFFFLITNVSVPLRYSDWFRVGVARELGPGVISVCRGMRTPGILYSQGSTVCLQLSLHDKSPTLPHVFQASVFVQTTLWSGHLGVDMDTNVDIHDLWHLL